MEPNMTTNSDRASAQIIQFPARGRFAPADQRDETLAMSASAARDETLAMSASAARVAKVAMGGAWYHDEAIAEAAHDRKN
jgi:hypothetical protein